MLMIPCGMDNWQKKQVVKFGLDPTEKRRCSFNVDATVQAIKDTCAHAGSSLAAGEFEGKVVKGRSHGAGQAHLPDPELN